MQATQLVSPHHMSEKIIKQHIVDCDYSKYLGSVGNVARAEISAISFPRIHNINVNSNLGNAYISQKGNANVSLSFLQLPIYVASASFEYDEDFEKKFEGYGISVSLRSILEEATEKALSLRAHQAVLFGVEGGGGLYNTAKNVAFPADSAGKTKLNEYNIHEFVDFLRKLIVKIYASDGYGAPRDFFIAAPTRVIAAVQTSITSAMDGLKSGSTVNADEWLRHALFGTGSGSNLDAYEWIADPFLVDADKTGAKPKDVVIIGARSYFDGEKKIDATFADLGAGPIHLDKLSDQWQKGRYSKAYMTEGFAFYDNMVAKFSVESGE